MTVYCDECGAPERPRHDGVIEAHEPTCSHFIERLADRIDDLDRRVAKLEKR